MRRYFILAAVALQVLVLAVMAGQREYILATGETVYLRTAPIDPRDPFRGDFVRLDYAISHIEPMHMNPVPEELPRGTVIYTMLQPDTRNVATPHGYSQQQPENGLYLRGRTRYRWYGGYGNTVRVDYGIETYFVQQGRGLEIERRQGFRNAMQIPMEMQLAVSPGGTAIIKGHRWSPLGIRLEILARETGEDTPPPGPRIRLSLMNASDEPLTVIDLPDYCSFSLQPAMQWSQPSWALAHDPCKTIRPQARHRVVLQPQALHSVTMDLAEPRWHISTQDNQILPIGSLPNERFRLVYHPPDPATIPQAAGSSPVWQGTLPSSAFSATGRVD